MQKVLIAEDDPTSQRLVATVVEQFGFSAIKCVNGRQAWEVLSNNPEICLVITDFMMPEMDGRDLVRLIRGHENFRQLPVIIVSAVVGIKDISDLLDLGASRFLPKPMVVDELRHYIDRELNHNGRAEVDMDKGQSISQ